MHLVLPVKDHELYNHKSLKIYWKPLLVICLFGSKKNINYQIKFTLNLLSSYQSLSFPEMKCVIQVNVGLEKCPFREVSIGVTVLRGTVHQGTVCWGNVCWG